MKTINFLSEAWTDLHTASKWSVRVIVLLTILMILTSGIPTN